jgi:hypothetical protein
MRTFTGLDLVRKLLKGDVSSADLETALTTNADLYLGPWREILKSTELNALLTNVSALAAIFGSDAAFDDVMSLRGDLIASSDAITETISNTGALAYKVLTNADYLDFWYTVPANKTRLSNRVNAVGSKIKRVSQLSAGGFNYTTPAGGILALAYGIVAGGGGGAAAQGGGGYGGQGGSGGESIFGQYTTPIAGGVNVAYTVGSAASTSQITLPSGAITATAGVTGTPGLTSASENPAVGTNTGTVFDSDLPNAIWQPNTGKKQGGKGGRCEKNSAPAQTSTPGTAGIFGAGGAAGANATPISGRAGTGIGSGGGGGPGASNNSGVGQASTSPGCGGGGGGWTSASGGTPQAGGAGYQGAAWIYVIEA